MITRDLSPQGMVCAGSTVGNGVGAANSLALAQHVYSQGSVCSPSKASKHPKASLGPFPLIALASRLPQGARTTGMGKLSIPRRPGKISP
jgi:hypothetical protein